MGWQAVQAALDVGDELAEKQIGTPHGEWIKKVTQAANEGRAPHLPEIPAATARWTAATLMRLALHRGLIEQSKPDSMRQALALLPKVPTRTGEKRIAQMKDEAAKLEEFASSSVKRKADVLAKQMIKAELAELQNEAHDAVTKEMKALQAQLKKERERIGQLMEDAAQKREFYEDLINKRMNGYDFKAGIKLLRQALHPDRKQISDSLLNKALDAVKHFERFFGVA
jgi:hypothetical protein